MLIHELVQPYLGNKANTDLDTSVTKGRLPSIPSIKLSVKHFPSSNLFIYLFIYFQFIYLWQILFHLAIGLAFHKLQGLSQTYGAINNIAECCYRWHQIFETEPQFVVLIKVNTNQNRNAKIRQYAPNWQMTLYQNDLIKTLKILSVRQLGTYKNTSSNTTKETKAGK